MNGEKDCVNYLGHTVGRGKVSIPEARAASIKNYVRPKTKKQLKSFLGLCGYYRKFVRHSSDIAKPLHALTHKSQPVKVVWTEESLASFSKLCSMFSCAEFLTIPTGSDKLLVQTDASTVGIGGCLSVYSRKLTDCESRYSATEL